MFKLKPVIYLIIALIVVAVVIYVMGKRDGNNDLPEPNPLPYGFDPNGTGSNGSQSNGSNDTPTYIPADVKYIAEQLYAAIEGWDSNSAKESAASLATRLSNQQLVDLNNYWNANYYSKWKQTLYQAMADEWGVSIFTIGTPSQWHILMESLSRLGLTGN